MTVRILQGHCLDVLATLPEKLVNTVVTSPPYWGLRDYGTETQSWPAIDYSPLPGLPPMVQIPAMVCSLGLEPTLEAFIGHMVLVFREVRRVMRDDGTLWMNMGDSYAGSRCGGDSGASTLRNLGQKIDASSAAKKNMTASRRRDDEPIPRSDVRVPGLKAKDLVGQPWRLALALQADGWWLRQDNIWHKPNPMPESTRDRCTKAHEYVFLLAKSERYYYDFEAMQEPCSESTHARVSQDVESQIGSLRAHAGADRDGRPMKAMVRKANNGVGFGHGYDANPKPRQTYDTPAGWATGTGRAHDELKGNYSGEHKAEEAGRRPKAWDNDMGSNRTLVDGYGRKLPGNKTHKGTAAYEAGDEHHRTKGGLVAYSERVRKEAEAGTGMKNNESFNDAMAVMPATRNKRSVWTVGTEAFKEAHFATFPTALIEPCIKAGCPEGGTVLDPFFGAGTTGLVSDRLQRNCIGIELNPEYVALAERRIHGDGPLFSDIQVTAVAAAA